MSEDSAAEQDALQDALLLLQGYTDRQRLEDVASPFRQLFTSGRRRQGPGEAEASRRFIQGVVNPLWAHLARSINNGGYLDQVTVLSHVKEMMQEVEQELMQLKNSIRARSSIRYVISDKAKQVGEDSPLSTINHVLPDSNGVVWVTGYTEGGAGKVLGRNGDTTISLTDKALKRFGLPPSGASYQDPTWDLKRTFRAGETLREAEESLADLIAEMEANVPHHIGCLEVLKFRIHLLSEALRQYKMYGGVARVWSDRYAPDPARLPMSLEEARIGAVAVHRVVYKERSAGEADKAGKAFFERFAKSTTERSVNNWANGRTRSNEITDEKVQKMKERKEVKDFVKGLSWTHGDE